MTTEKEQLEAEIAERDARIAELVGVRDHLRMQASIQAQEARTQKSIVAEIGAMVGEPCDWLTASAVREALKAQQPSAGVACALMSALEGIVHDQRVPNEVSQECAAVLIEARRPNPCRAQAVPDGEELKVLRAFYQCCASITDQLADSPKSALARLVEAVKDAAASANSEQARSCVTCNGVGIIGHSTLCPECATAPSTQRKESGDE